MPGQLRFVYRIYSHHDQNIENLGFTKNVQIEPLKYELQ